MLYRVEFDDDKLSASDAALSQWSDEALELNLMIKKLGLVADICVEDYLIKFFKTFYLKKANIGHLDEQLLKFDNLQVLNLSYNRISRVENIPCNLKELYLTGN